MSKLTAETIIKCFKGKGTEINTYGPMPKHRSYYND